MPFLRARLCTNHMSTDSGCAGSASQFRAQYMDRFVRNNFGPECEPPDGPNHLGLEGPCVAGDRVAKHTHACFILFTYHSHS